MLFASASIIIPTWCHFRISALLFILTIDLKVWIIIFRFQLSFKKTFIDEKNLHLMIILLDTEFEKFTMKMALNFYKRLRITFTQTEKKQ